MFVLFKNVMPKKLLIQLGYLFCYNAIAAVIFGRTLIDGYFW